MSDAFADNEIIAELKELQSVYHAKAKNLEYKIFQLTKSHHAEDVELYDKRARLLAYCTKNDNANAGTPACEGFWRKAMDNNETVSEFIQPWDLAILDLIKDITYEDKSETNFVLEFNFVENEHFENKVIRLEVVRNANLLNGSELVTKITCDNIIWKKGKNITVAKNEKKLKGSKARQARQAKLEKDKDGTAPRDSFFRRFLCSYETGKKLPQAVKDLPQYTPDGDEEDVVEQMLAEVAEAAQEIRTCVVPFAWRWYTGEAAPAGIRDRAREQYEDDEAEYAAAMRAQNGVECKQM